MARLLMIGLSDFLGLIFQPPVGRPRIIGYLGLISNVGRKKRSSFRNTSIAGCN